MSASPDITSCIQPFSYRYKAVSAVIDTAVNIHNTIILIFRVKIVIISLHIFGVYYLGWGLPYQPIYVILVTTTLDVNNLDLLKCERTLERRV